MKKIFGVILILIYSLLFFVVLNIFSENDHYNMYNDFGFNEKYENTSVYFEDPLQDDEKRTVIQIVEEMTDEFEVAVIKSEYIEDESQLIGIRKYVSGNDQLISEMLPDNMDVNEDFVKGNQYISNSNKEDHNKIDLFTFYQGLTYVVIPFHFLEEDLEAIKYDIMFGFHPKDRTLIEDMIKEKFSDLNISLGPMSTSHYDRNEALQKSILFMSVIAFFIFILFILFTISYHVKDIAILKLNGFKIVDILSYIFKSNVLISIILAFLVPILLSVIVFRTFNARIMSFNGVNILAGLLLVVLFIVLLILSTIVISQYRLSDFIKNKNINAGLTNITYGVLILAAIIVLPMVQEPLSNLFETVQAYAEVKTNAKKIENIHEMRFSEEKRAWEFDQLAYLNDEFHEKNQKQIDLYDDLDEMDAIYHFRPNVIAPQSVEFEELENHLYAAYNINEKYFKESNFSINGKSIEIDDSDHLSILMDVRTFESYDWQKNDFIREDVDAAIYLFDQSDYLNFENERIEGYNNVEAPIFIYSENDNLFMKNLSDGGFYIDGRQMDEINRYLSSKNLENEIEFFKLNDRSNLYTEGLLNTLKDAGIQILPGLISLLAVFVSFTNFHRLEKNKEIKILKSLGYKTLTISNQYIQSVFLVNLVFIAYLFWVRNNMDFRLVFYLFILSVAMISLYLHKVNRAQIKNI